MDKYYLLVLKYLSTQTTITDFRTTKIEGIDDDFLITNDLAKKDLVSCGSGHNAWINQNGRDYLKKHELGIKEERSPIVHVGHNINAPVSQSDFSNVVDNSLNKQNITKTTEINSHKRSRTEKLYWIVGIIVGLLAIYEYLHKVHFVLKF